MTHRRHLSLLVVIASAVLGSCAALPYTADLSAREIRPPTMLTSSPIPRTLFIVVRPDRVPDDFSIRDSPHSIRSFRGYFARAIASTLRDYFLDVRIVPSPPSAAQLATTGPSAIADVRSDGIENRDLPTASYTYRVLRMQWAFAIRPAESDDYLFSYGGIGTSDHAYQTLEAGVEQLMLSAIAGFLEGWTEQQVFRAFRALPTPGSAAPTGAETPDIVDAI